MSEHIVVFIMAGSEDEAFKIGRGLVEGRLVACVNIIQGVRSLFWWKGEICDEGEILLMAKSMRGKLEQIVDKVKQLHSYEVPEIIALPIVGGSEDYLRWVGEETE